MSWKELLEKLQTMSSNELLDTATVYLARTDEYIGIAKMRVADDDGVLDEGHKVLEVDF